MFLRINTRRGEQIINTDHIIRITPPKGTTKYTIWMDEIDYEEDGTMINYWESVIEPSFEELVEKLGGTI